VHRLGVFARFVSRNRLHRMLRRAKGSTLATHDLLLDLPTPLPENSEELFTLIVKPDRTNRHWQALRQRALPLYLDWATHGGGRMTPATRSAMRAHIRNLLRRETVKLEHYRDWQAIAACCELAQRLESPIVFTLACHDVEAEQEERRRGESPATERM
jgi:hypothetical protein